VSSSPGGTHGARAARNHSSTVGPQIAAPSRRLAKPPCPSRVVSLSRSGAQAGESRTGEAYAAAALGAEGQDALI
jgi:hypothetical protein